MPKLDSRSQLTAPARGDWMLVQDISDTGDGGTGTSKKSEIEDILKGAPIIVAANDAPADWKKHADYLCNGTADQSEINSAIAALTSGGMVQLSPGTFNISDDIEDQSKNNISLVGCGDSTVLFLPNGANSGGAVVILNLSSVSGWTLRDFRIDGNRANNTADDLSHGIYLYACNECVLENLTVDNAAATGIRLDSGSDKNKIHNCHVDNSLDFCLALNSDCDDNLITNCWLGQNYEDPTVTIRYGCDNNRLSGCRIYDIPGNTAGIQLLGSSTACQNNVISDNIIDGVQTTPDSREAYGISISGNVDNAGTVVSGNTITRVRWGLGLGGVGPGAITGNTIRYCDVGITLAGGPWTITGNTIDTIQGTAGDGSAIDVNSSNNIIVGNYCANCAAHSIDLDADNNVVVSNKSTGGSLKGVNIRTGADYNTVIANDVTDDGITNAGSSNIIRNNMGYVTENKGTGSIESGTTADVITHGLVVTPVAQDIVITWTNNPDNDPGVWWVDNIGSTTFQVNCESNPGASNWTFGWAARVL